MIDNNIFMPQQNYDVEAASGILNKINQLNEEGDSPLIAAIKNQLTEDVVKILKTPGVNVNLSNSEGDTPLMIAIRKGNLDIVNLLIESGADVNLSDPEGVYIPLIVALQEENIDIVNLL